MTATRMDMPHVSESFPSKVECPSVTSHLASAALGSRKPEPRLPEPFVIEHGRVHFGLFLRQHHLDAKKGFRKLCAEPLEPVGTIKKGKGSIRVGNYLVLSTRSKDAGYEIWQWHGSAAVFVKAYDDLDGSVDMATQMAEKDARSQFYDASSIAPRNVRGRPQPGSSLTFADELRTRTSRPKTSSPSEKVEVPPVPMGYSPIGAGLRSAGGKLMGAIRQEGSDRAIVAGMLRGEQTFRLVDLNDLQETGAKSKPSGLRPIVQHTDLDELVSWAREWTPREVRIPNPHDFTGSGILSAQGTPTAQFEIQLLGLDYAVVVYPNLDAVASLAQGMGSRRSLGASRSWSGAMMRIRADLISRGQKPPVGLGVTPKSVDYHPWFDYHLDLAP